LSSPSQSGWSPRSSGLTRIEAFRSRRSRSPRLAIFDLYDEWFHRDDYEACSFVNVLLELGAAHPAGKASVDHLANLRSIVHGLADQAHLEDPDGFTRSWYILMKGSIVARRGLPRRRQTRQIDGHPVDRGSPSTHTPAPKIRPGTILSCRRSSRRVMGVHAIAVALR